jgi:hypothetical protein
MLKKIYIIPLWVLNIKKIIYLHFKRYKNERKTKLY